MGMGACSMGIWDMVFGNGVCSVGRWDIVHGNGGCSIIMLVDALHAFGH